MDAPRITAATLWVGAWLRGTAAPDDVLCVLADLAPDSPAVVRLDGAPSAGLADLLAHLRAEAAAEAWLLLPRPGRTLGWPAKGSGAPAPATVISGADGMVGLLRHERAGWTWESVADDSALAVIQAGMLTPRAAARTLVEVVTVAAEDLEQLGLDRPPRGRCAQEWQAGLGRLPKGMDPPTLAQVTRIAALRDALDLALADDGAAVTAAEARARAARIREVAGAVDDVLCGVLGGLNVPRVACVGPNIAPVPWPG